MVVKSLVDHDELNRIENYAGAAAPIVYLYSPLVISADEIRFSSYAALATPARARSAMIVFFIVFV